MSGAARRRLLLLVVACVAAFAIFAPRRPDGSEARRALEQAAALLSPGAGETPEAYLARVERDLAGFLTSDAVVSLPGQESLVGRQAVVAKGVELCRGRRPALELREVRTTRHAPDAVRLSFEVVVSDSQVGDLHASSRWAEAELRRSLHGWRLHRLEVDAERRSEPEARP